jgi:DNA-binding transcriptional MocR family regulator
MDRRISASRAAALLGKAPETSPAYAGIADALRLLISDGRIPPGTRLPSERELTDALGVSRTTVTRAYATLKDRGYLTSRQGSGTVAQVPSTARVTDSLLSPGPSDPGRIDLTCAAPSAPPGVLAAFEAAVAELPGHLQELGYFPSGLPALREAIARRYAERGLPTDPEQILVTSGALAGLAVVSHAFVGLGDRILLESPSYPTAIAALRGTGARIAGADVGEPGWGTSSVIDWVGQLRPAAAYLIPDWHNPTGQLMGDEHRSRLAAAMREAGTLPIIDESMVELAIDDVAMPLPFAAHHPGAITLGSASKTYWGGLRIGWVRAPHARMQALVTSRLTLDLGAPVLEQLALVHLMARREEVLATRRAQLAESRATLVSGLASRLPSWCFRVPAGGLTLWCELPRPTATALAAVAERHGLQIAAGPLFAPEGGLDRYVRLPFSHPAARLEEAVDRLAEAWDALPTAVPSRRKPAPALVT